jgi:predicted metal-dependent hydrolase
MPGPQPDGEAAAARSITLAGQAVAYQLRRSRRRTIGLSIDQRGLRVGAPLRARLGDIEALISEHGQWVLDKLAAWRERPLPARTPFTDGGTVFAFGTALTAAIRSSARAAWHIDGCTLHLAVPAAADPEAILQTALREHARAVLHQRLALLAPRLGVAVPPLRLSSARTRWGSCNQRGGIALNWRLVFMPLAVVDYVVAHELAHLKEMNHGPRFWAVVEQLCPDWRALRSELRRRGREIPQS